VAAGGFFSSGLVIEELILDCYRLAKHYGRDPDEMLNKPLSVIARHLMWTSTLIERTRPVEED
jgi:hypothetical protein